MHCGVLFVCVFVLLTIVSLLDRSRNVATMHAWCLYFSPPELSKLADSLPQTYLVRWRCYWTVLYCTHRSGGLIYLEFTWGVSHAFEFD